MAKMTPHQLKMVPENSENLAPQPGTSSWEPKFLNGVALALKTSTFVAPHTGTEKNSREDPSWEPPR
jgi:hypothetical protein